MDIEPKVSPQIIDRRQVTSHGITAVICLLIGFLSGHQVAPDPDPDLVYLTSTALDRGQAYWGHQGPYHLAYVVLIPPDGMATPCGAANRESGPFYCPADEHIYLDVTFLRAISGDLARAYVVAHELAHHVQKLRGTFDQNLTSVQLELGADCLAGQWMANEQATGHLGSGDVAAAIQEAQNVGDDRLCPSCTMESWTHGSSAQRAAAVAQGLSGSCDRL